jgi:hypothetical protein
MAKNFISLTPLLSDGSDREDEAILTVRASCVATVERTPQFHTRVTLLDGRAWLVDECVPDVLEALGSEEEA